MIKGKLAVALLLIGSSGLYILPAIDAQEPSAPQAQTPRAGWQKEFDDVCSKTDDAMTFSQDELSDLVRRCDTLLPQIDKLDESRKKVYSGRLRMCRGLYAYVLEAKRNEKK